MMRWMAVASVVVLFGCGATLSGPTSGESIEVKDAIFAVATRSDSSGRGSYLYLFAGNHPDLCSYAAGSAGAQKANMEAVGFFGLRFSSGSGTVAQWSAGRLSLGDFVQGPPESPTSMESYAAVFSTTNASCEPTNANATGGTIKIDELSAESLTAELDFVLPGGGAITGRVKARRCAALESGTAPGTSTGICER